MKEYVKSMGLGDAILKAIDDCIRRNVLKDFLESHKHEVYNMLLGDWNWDDALAVRYEEGVGKGFAKGVAIGETKGLLQAARQMKAEKMGSDLISRVTGLSEIEIERL